MSLNSLNQTGLQGGNNAGNNALYQTILELINQLAAADKKISNIDTSTLGSVLFSGDVFISKILPRLIELYTGASTKARFFQPVPDALAITLNLDYDGANWLADDVGKVGHLMYFDLVGNQIIFYISAIGANPRSAGLNPFWRWNFNNTVFSTPLIDLYNGSIFFPTTQIPNAGANALDDYEEGAWTAIDVSGAGLAFTSGAGHYIKIGKLVYFNVVVAYPATASGLPAKIGGLPYTTQTPQPGGGAQSAFMTIGLNVNYYVRETSTQVELYLNTGAAVTNNQLSGITFYYSGNYIAAN